MLKHSTDFQILRSPHAHIYINILIHNQTSLISGLVEAYQVAQQFYATQGGGLSLADIVAFLGKVAHEIAIRNSSE